MNLAILTPIIQAFISKHLNSDLMSILLSKSPFKDVTTRELVEQIEGKKKCEKKLPLWYNTPEIYFPPRLAIEQASSQITAQYKAKLIKGESVIDITGGFGVDSYYFGLHAKHVVHCELNNQLSAIVKHNATKLHPNMVCYEGDGLTYLQNTTEKFSTIYIDPSRRVKTQKVFKLTDCEPNVIDHFKLLTKNNARLIIKTSPLLDIKLGLTSLPNVSEIHILSVKNDCKELLWVIDSACEKSDPKICCVAIDGENNSLTCAFYLSEEKLLSQVTYSEPLNFVYEPDVALLKSGGFKLITKMFGVSKLHCNTQLYTSEILVTNFIGKKFKVINVSSYKDFAKQKLTKQANIIVRNFPLSVEELKKKHKLKDGGENYIIFTTNNSDQLIVINCERI